MSNTEESKSNAAEEMESKLEEREQARREGERDEWENVNQNIQTGTHDATHLGINWGPSYKALRRKPKRSRSPKNE
jgi:hypothetical protein